MNNTLEHKGYLGTVDYSADDNCLFGKIVGINDLVSYEGQSVSELITAFKEAVDDYLETCQELGKEPEKRYKGVFNVRTSNSTHKTLVRLAAKKRMKLNELANAALTFLVNNEDIVLENYNN